MKKFTLLALLGLLCTFCTRATVTFTLTTPPCDTTGVLTVHFTTAAPGPYTVYWSGGAGSSGYAYTSTSTLSSSISNYVGGLCNVSIYSGATFIDSGAYYTAPAFTFSFPPGPAYCGSVGTATVSVSGGTPPYTYKWYSASAPSTILSTSNPATLPTGGYGVWITDAAGCATGSPITHVYDEVIPTPTFSFSIATTAANCTNGTATITGPMTGSVPPLTYLWSNGATTPSLSGLTMGTYTATVTDAAGCTYTTQNIVHQAITINPFVTPTSSTCGAPDGSVIAFGSGGVSPYTYVWSNGATTQSQSGLAPGTYSVTATDVNGCIGFGSGTITTFSPVMATYTTTPSSCTTPTGTATLLISGGTSPYSVYWYTSPPQTTVTATALIQGNYDFKITDAAGCLRTGTVTVPPIHIINTPFSVTAALCSSPTGALGVTPSGGTTPYTYSWSTGATSSFISSLVEGLYHVTVTDAAGCHVTNSQWVPSYTTMHLGATTTPATCLYNADGIISLMATGGTPPYTYHPGGSTGITSGLLTGHYYTWATDAAGCMADRWVYVGYNAANTSCYCTIAGTVYHDVNGNCVRDAGEPGIAHMQMHCTGHDYVYTDDSGHYEFKVPSGTYTVSENILAYYPLSPCQSNSITVTASAATGCVIPQDFANVINPIHDMHVSQWHLGPPVIGNTYNTFSIISNDGTVPEPAMLGSYKPDGQLLAPTFVPASLFTGAPYYYTTSSTFPTMAPGATQVIYRNYIVPTDVPIGTVVLFKDSVVAAAPMSSWTSDYSPWNNVAAYTATVVAAYDPNFKDVRPQGVGPNGNISYTDSVLEYMVHFQNTGSWYAQNIEVLDTLDNDLEWTSLKPAFQSANCQVSLTQSGTYKVAKFRFENINLPPQMWDDLRSNGFFTYTIKQKAGLPLGTQFKNRASIYFDYNAPIRTNETINTLAAVAPNSVPNATSIAANGFTVYPNPTNGSFTISVNSLNAGSGSIAVTDVTGKTMLSKTVQLNQGLQSTSIDASQFAPGVYFVSLNHNGKIETQKLVIIK